MRVTMAKPVCLLLTCLIRVSVRFEWLTSCTPKEGTTPAKETPAKACFVYGDDGNGDPTSTYVSDSPFPSSVASFISGLLPLTNVSVAASSLITGKAVLFPTTGTPDSTSLSSQAIAKAGTTDIPSQTTGAAAATSASSAITSAPTSTTGRSSNAGQTTTTSQPVASSQKSAAEGTWSMIANVSIYIYMLVTWDPLLSFVSSTLIHLNL